MTAANIKTKRNICISYAFLLITLSISFYSTRVAYLQGRKASQVEKKLEQQLQNTEHAKRKVVEQKHLAQKEKEKADKAIKEVEELKIKAKELRIKIEKEIEKAEKERRKYEELRRKNEKEIEKAENAELKRVQATESTKKKNQEVAQLNQKIIALNQTYRTLQKAIASRQNFITPRNNLARAELKKTELNQENVSSQYWGNWNNKYSQKHVSFPNLAVWYKDKKNNQLKSVLVTSEEYLKVSINGPYTFKLSSDEGSNFGWGGEVLEVSPE